MKARIAIGSTARIRDSIHEEILQALARGDDARVLESLVERAEAVPEEEQGREALIRCARAALQVQRQIEQHQQRERGFVAVSETAAALTRMLTRDEVLEGIVKRGRQLLGCHLAWLAGIDGEVSTYVLAIDGQATEAARKMRGPPYVGVAGKVVKTGAPFSSKDYTTDSRFAHEPDLDTVLRSEGLRGVAGVPLMSDGQVIGVLIVGDRYPRLYQAWEISILSTLASHAAIAIRNARIFEAERTALATMEDANKRLEDQSAAVRVAADAHEKFTLLVVRGGGISDLGPMAADALVGSVVITDQAGVVICSTARPGTPPVPVQPHSSGAIVGPRIRAAIAESRREGRSVIVPITANESCRVAASVGGTGLLGSVVICTPEPLTAAAVRILERAAMVVTLLLLSRERRSATASEEVTHVVRKLLGPHAEARTEHIERAGRFGLDLAKPLILVALELDEVRPGQARDRISDALKDMPRLVSELDGLLVLLLAGDDSAQVRELVSELLFTTLKFRGLGAVSKPCRGTPPGVLSGVHQRLIRCIGLLRGLGRMNAVVLESELTFYAELLRGQGPDDLNLFLRGTIGGVLDRDARRNSHLAETLLAYLDNGYSAKDAAEDLGIHVNTLMNRLEILNKILGDWQGQRMGAELHVALKVWRLQNAHSLPG